METKPFSLQSPEQVAKDYGGNKQKIAQAAQMGTIDPTAAVLAGMFIDRMRAAQGAESAPQQTVAQQVLAPQPQMPPQGMPPAGGLGATPPAMGAAPAPTPGMEAQQMGVPPQVGMAEGGIVGLDIPDTMYDEPSNGGFNDGYAGGGLVAFGSGGRVDYSQFAEVIPAQESGGNYAARNKQSGALGKYQLMPPTAKALAKRLGLPFDMSLLTSDTPAGRAYQDALGQAAMKEAWDYGKGDPQLAANYYHGGPNQKGWGPNTQKYGRDILGRLGQEGTPTPREADTNTAQGRAMSFEDAMAAGQGMLSGLPREAMDLARTEAMQALDPAAQEKDRKEDMWMALANMGFSMASTESPYLLQAIGQAAMTTLPGIEASKKERKAAKNEAIRTLMSLEDVDRKTATAGVELGMDVYKTGLSSEQFEAKLSQEKELTEAELQNRRDVATIGANASIQSAQLRDSQFDTARAAREEQIKQRLAQGLPVLGPDGQPAFRNSNPSAAEIAVLANNWAIFDLNKYKQQSQQGGGLALFDTQGNSGGAQSAQVDYSKWKPVQ